MAESEIYSHIQKDSVILASFCGARYEGLSKTAILARQRGDGEGGYFESNSYHTNESPSMHSLVKIHNTQYYKDIDI